MVQVILPDTSLCAIVRDEMINPAQLPGKSGIRSFVESHVPYVEQAVIVDTGSIDGTRKELEQLASEFPNLKVYDKPFKDYAGARNHSLKKVETKRALVLDVDELITRGDFGKILEISDSFQEVSLLPFFYFHFGYIDATGYVSRGRGHPIRLMNKKNTKFFNSYDNAWEYIYARTSKISKYKKVEFESPNSELSPVNIFHFAPGQSLSHENSLIVKNSIALKLFNWYSIPDKFSQPPLLREGFKTWKQPNPHRSKYN